MGHHRDDGPDDLPEPDGNIGDSDSGNESEKTQSSGSDSTQSETESESSVDSRGPKVPTPDHRIDGSDSEDSGSSGPGRPGSYHSSSDERSTGEGERPSKAKTKTKAKPKPKPKPKDSSDSDSDSSDHRKKKKKAKKRRSSSSSSSSSGSDLPPPDNPAYLNQQNHVGGGYGGYAQSSSRGGYVQPQAARTNNLCGNPECGKTFICAADYNRTVQPMGYRGV